jgi:S-adenosyl methyltransferase
MHITLGRCPSRGQIGVPAAARDDDAWAAAQDSCNHLRSREGRFAGNVPPVSSPLIPFDAGKPNVARGYDYVLGGKDNFAADRDLYAKVLRIYPLAGALVRENREFQARAVDYVARSGVLQFIKVGSGLPKTLNTHEAAGQVSPAARVAYVDNDPVVISHISALLARPGSVAAVPGDMRCPAAILASPALTELIDTSQPFCLMLTMILDLVEPARAASIVDEFRRAMPPGSFFVASVSVNNDRDLAERMLAAYTAATVHLHTREEIGSYFAGFELVEPGLTEARRWRPPHPEQAACDRPADVLAGVGRKPARGQATGR